MFSSGAAVLACPPRSMMVTGLGDQFFWWQIADVGDVFNRCGQNSVTNIQQLSPVANVRWVAYFSEFQIPEILKSLDQMIWRKWWFGK